MNKNKNDKMSEESLSLMTEIQLKDLFAAITDVILVVDENGRYLEIAPTDPTLLYMPANKILGKTIKEIFPAEQAEFFLSKIRETLSAKKAINLEYSLMIGDKEVSFLGTLSTLSVNKVVLVARDITELKKVQEKFRESEEKYRQLTELTPDGILVHVDGKIVYANSASAKILGATEPKGLVGRSVLDFVHPDFQVIVKERVNNIIQENEIALAIQEQLIRLDGSVIYAEVTAIPFNYQNKKAVQVVFSDITSRKQSEDRLRESEEKFRSITEQIKEMVYITDIKGIITYVSPASLQIFGFLPEEMQARDFTDFLDESQIPKAITAFTQATSLGVPSSGLELLMKRKDGTLFTGELNGVVYKLPDYPGTLGLIRDITNRKQAESVLKEKMNELKHFNDLTVGRELIMIGLKKEINELLKQAGKEEKYKIVL